MPPIPMGVVLPGEGAFKVPISRIHSQELTPAPSAGSIMGALQEPTHPKDDPVLVAFMEGAVEASMVVEAGTDSSREVIKP